MNDCFYEVLTVVSRSDYTCVCVRVFVRGRTRVSVCMFKKVYICFFFIIMRVCIVVCGEENLV